MAYRDSESDTGRRGAAPSSRGKAAAGYQYPMPNPKGDFMPAYGGGRGRTNTQVDPYYGTDLEEVGNDLDDNC